MQGRALDCLGWAMYGVGTLGTISADEVGAIGLAIAGLIVVVSRAGVKSYQDYRKARRAEMAEDFKQELEQERQLAEIRHSELTGKLEQVQGRLTHIEQVLTQAKCPVLEGGACRYQAEPIPDPPV